MAMLRLQHYTLLPFTLHLHRPTAAATVPSSSAASSCFANPTQAKCTNIDTIYTPQEVMNDFNGLCRMMGQMSGCLIEDSCSTHPAGATGTPCAPWTLLADICSSQGGASMTTMSGCSKFNQLCRNASTVVERCNTPVTPSLVLYKAAAEDTISMCSSMSSMSSMRGCSECTSANACPRPLTSLSTVCMSMDMGKCGDWEKMCTSNSLLLPTFCDPQFNTTTGQCEVSSMKMYFHGGLHDMVLFKEWYACTIGQYLFVLHAVFLIAVGSSAFRVLRRKIEHILFSTCCQHRCSSFTSWTANVRTPLLPLGTGGSYCVEMGVDGMTCSSCVQTVQTAAMNSTVAVAAASVVLQNSGSAKLRLECQFDALNAHVAMISQSIENVGFDIRSTSDPIPWQSASSSPYPRNAIKAAMTALQMTVDYALMLAAMTFNTGVFFAVVLGYAMGTLLFAHIRDVKDIGDDDDNSDDLPSCCTNEI